MSNVLNMSIVFLTAAAAMLAYDFAGHALAAIAELYATWGYARAAYLWNNYSTFVFPRISNQLHYNIYWTVWHGMTLTLFLLAYWLKGE